MSAPSRSYSAYMLGVLAAANLLHYANRNVLFHSEVYADLREAYALTNAEIGFLGTMAFMVPHALVTVPIGWFADRYDRRRLMAGGVLLWSVGAIGSTLASGFWPMLAFRGLVGLGCAACVPVANAMICQRFPGDTKARGVSIFNLGLFLGGAVGLTLGGALGFPAALVVVGIPGLGVAVLVATLRSPERGAGRGPAAQAPLSVGQFFRDAWSIFAMGRMRWMMAGAVLMAFAAGGYLGWFIEFLTGPKGMSSGDATNLFIAALVVGLLGVLCGGAVADSLQRRFPFGRQLAVVIGFWASVPCAILTIQLPAGAVFTAMACCLMFFSMWYHAPVAAAVDDLVSGGRAATSQAVYVFLMHLIGTAPSAWAVGALADRVGLDNAMYLPTGAMGLAGAAFLMACAGTGSDLVVKPSADG